MTLLAVSITLTVQQKLGNLESCLSVLLSDSLIYGRFVTPLTSITPSEAINREALARTRTPITSEFRKLSYVKIPSILEIIVGLLLLLQSATAK